MNFCAFMGKRRNLEVRIIMSIDRGRRAGSVKINNSLEIETSADKNCFYFDFGYFCSFFNEFLRFYGKTEKLEVGVIMSVDRGRRARSVKINNILEIETCADKNCFYFDFGYFCSFFNKFLRLLWENA